MMMKPSTAAALVLGTLALTAASCNSDKKNQTILDTLENQKLSTAEISLICDSTAIRAKRSCEKTYDSTTQCEKKGKKKRKKCTTTLSKKRTTTSLSKKKIKTLCNARVNNVLATHPTNMSKKVLKTHCKEFHKLRKQ